MADVVGIQVLIVCAADRVCALRLADVVETMRPLRVESLPDTPTYILGMSVVRGAPLPVLNLGLLFGVRNGSQTHRWVTMRTDDRMLVLAVESVRGVHRLDVGTMESLPTLLQATEAVESVGTLDRQLVTLLKSGRLLTPDQWKEIEEAAESGALSAAATGDAVAAAERPPDDPGDKPRRGKRARHVPGD